MTIDEAIAWNKMQRQRDELVAACEGLMTLIGLMCSDAIKDEPEYKAAVAAISKAKGTP